MISPQSKGSWYGDEVRARYIEGRRAVRRQENKLRWDTVHSALIREFAEDEGLTKYGPPSDRQIRKWEKQNPDFPEEIRKRGFLKGLEPLEYKPVAGGFERVPVPTFPLAPSIIPQAIPTAQGRVVEFEALTGWLAFCMVVGMLTAMAHLVISSL
jgi:hypothetical protein